jgi:glycine cleavage system aminomethyltransferase T
MVEVDHTEIGTTVEVATSEGMLTATVVERPFYDPKKTLAAA